MAPPRTMMRQTDDTVSTGLQQLIRTEREYVETLRSLESRVALRLRFCGAHNPCPSVVEWLAFAKQLATLHALYTDKLQQLVEDTASTIAQIEAVLEDLLLVTRVVYAPLHVRRAQLKDAFDSQLKLKGDAATVVLREYLQSNKLTSQQFVSLPIKHLYDLLERVDIIIGSTTMTAACEATRHFLVASEQDALKEAQLIALQTALRGSPLEMDMCGRTLLCRVETTLSRTSSEEKTGLVLDQTVHAAHDVYCLDDGTVLFLERESPSSGVGLCINLKSDSVFLEPVPRSVGEPVSHPAAIVLAGPSSSLLVACKPETSVADFYEFIDCATTLLVHNESRTQLLKHGRTADDFDIPKDLKATPEPPLVVFPCFHDDALPGMFWMHDTAASRDAWMLVELVQVGSWVLLFAVSGWHRHHLIHRVDLATTTAVISEAPRSDANWSLWITTDPESKGLELVSERRARIDFWYDQLTKTVEAEKRKVEEQAAKAAKAAKAAAAEAEAQAAAAAAKAAELAASEKDTQHDSSADAFIDMRAKKRQRNTTPVKANATVTTETSSPARTVTTPVVEEPATTTLLSGKTRRRAKACSVSDANDTGKGDEDSVEERTQPDAESTTRSTTNKRQRTTPVKTPKQRWVRRKTDDPDDEALEATQPGEAGSADHSVASGEEPAREPESATPANASADPKSAASIRIIFTGIEPTPKILKKMNAIPGAMYEDNIEKATHVIAPKNTLKRTVKLLCGISVCDHILDERWLDESARVRTAVYERQYCLKDAKAEAKWGFDLVQTMYNTPKDQRRRLFDGRRFYITPHKTILPPVQDLVKIVEQAGGSVVTSGTPQVQDLVVTSEAALATTAIAKLAAKCECVYTPELILSSILQQRLDTSQHRLETAASTSTRTPQRSRGARS
jgi:hypothetical protein